MANKGKLLFLSPTVPALSGHGSAMRAGVMLEALSVDFEISLVVLDAYRKRRFHQDGAWAAQWCTDVKIIPGPGKVADAPDSRESFDVIHMFRLVTAHHFARSYLLSSANTHAKRVLDLDDYESQTRLRFAKLAWMCGDPVRAQWEETQAFRFAAMERTLLPDFDKVYVCSEEDRLRLSAVHGQERIAIVPNAVRLPVQRPSVANCCHVTLLFVGTLDYYPNEDGITYFCQEILPLLRRTALGCFRVLIVGTRPTQRVLMLAAHPEVTVVGEVPSLDAYYSLADIMIVPLRAGGGTRIKILEAFAHQRPVVSTSVGAEGLRVADREHLLLADTPEAFAGACASLMSHTLRGRDMASRAFAWVAAHHSIDRVRCCLRANLSKVTMDRATEAVAHHATC